MKDNSIALLCTLHPTSHEHQKKILSLLRKGAREYYRLPPSNCTTWSYFTPYPPSNSSTLKPPAIAGFEIYTDKSALQKQLDNREFFQAYHETVEREGLYAREERLEAWYAAAGFVARGAHALPFGTGSLVSLTRIEGDREGVLGVLREVVPFVRDKEPDVLTYMVFTRPKAPREVLIFVRYRDARALRRHAAAEEHGIVAEKMAKFTEMDLSKATTIWQEVEDSFVSTQPGGPASDAKL